MRIELKITGMHCKDCAVTVEEALRRTPGVDAASVSYLKKKATVELANAAGLQAALAAVAEAGYGAEPLEATE
jgi:copper chaperone CopZ